MFEKFLKFLHWQKRSKPEIDLSPQIYQELKPFRFPIILTIIIMMLGTIGYVAIEDVDVFTAFYQTGITFTTVGFGEMFEMSKNGQLFSVFLIISGFATFSFAIGIMIEAINKGNLLSLVKERKMLYKIARLKKHFVVCYHNEHTVELTRELRKAHIPFVVVSPDNNLEEIAKEHSYPFYIKGEPHTELAMRKAHMSSAKGVISLAKSIADNIALISSVRLFEKEIGRRPYYLMSVADNSANLEKLKKLGADEVVSPMKLMAKKMTATAVNPKIKNILEEFVYQKDTLLDLEELKIPSTSWLIDKKLKESHIRDITNVSVVGIRKKNGKFLPMPKGDEIIEYEDVLLIIGTSASMKKTRQLLRKKTKPQEMKYV